MTLTKSLMVAAFVSTTTTTALAGHVGDPAGAGTVTATSTSGARAGAGAIAQTGAVNVTQTVQQPAPIVPYGAPAGYGPGYGGRGRIPDTAASLSGAVSGGNPCGLGAQAGMGLPSFTGLFSWMWEGHGCEWRQKAALTAQLAGDNQAGLNVMCDDDTAVETAMAELGRPCASTQKRWNAEYQKQGYRWVRNPNGTLGWLK